VSSIKRDSTCPAPAGCDNFLYGFKGARSAPRAWRRFTAHATGGRAGSHSKSGRDAPAGTRRTTRRSLALVRKHTAAAAEVRTPGHCAASAEYPNPPRVRERGHPPGAVIVEAEQDHRQGRRCS